MAAGFPWINKIVSEPSHLIRHLGSELLLFLEEHRETDDGSIDQKTTENRHDHGRELDLSAVRKNNGERYKHTVSAFGLVSTEQMD